MPSWQAAILGQILRRIAGSRTHPPPTADPYGGGDFENPLHRRGARRAGWVERPWRALFPCPKFNFPKLVNAKVEGEHPVETRFKSH